MIRVIKKMHECERLWFFTTSRNWSLKNGVWPDDSKYAAVKGYTFNGAVNMIYTAIHIPSDRGANFQRL